MTDRKPNILLIMVDQMRGDCLSLEGHPVLLTPNLDELGGRGAHFRRAYSTCPSCIPARRAFLTGQHPQTNGMVGMTNNYPIRTTTLPEQLRRADYQTYLVGRSMHQSPPGRRYGYDHMLLGSTYLADDAYAEHLAAEAPYTQGVRGVGLSPNGWAARPWPYPDHLHPTEWTVQRSMDFFKHHRDETCPCFLTASFYAPHPPLLPPAFYMDRYLRANLPEPAIGDWAHPPEGPGFAWGVDVCGIDAYGTDSPRVHLTGEALRSAMAGYFGLINHIDDQLSILIRQFRQASKQEGRSWLIVFASDHGEMLGDHYRWRKCEAYEGSARIPMLIQGSRDLELSESRVCDSPVCLEDLMPTLLDLADVPIPDHLDGRSLVPVLRGEADGVRDVLHGEHAPHHMPEQGNHYLTDGRSKYIWRPCDGSDQLFSLADDPKELHDLSGEPAHQDALAVWRRRLAKHLAHRPEGFSDGERLIAGRDYPKVMPHLEAAASGGQGGRR